MMVFAGVCLRSIVLHSRIVFQFSYFLRFFVFVIECMLKVIVEVVSFLRFINFCNYPYFNKIVEISVKIRNIGCLVKLSWLWYLNKSYLSVLFRQLHRVYKFSNYLFFLMPTMYFHYRAQFCFLDFFPQLCSLLLRRSSED